MRVTLFGCPFRTSYGYYIDSLRRAMEAQSSETIEWVASNCGCGDPIERAKLFQIKPTAYFEMSHVSDYESKIPWRRWLRRNARNFTYYFRARRYAALSRDREVLHFQQTLHAFGAMAAFHWLKLNSTAAKVITVHEIEPYQVKFPQVNLAYNKADAIVVHNNELKDRLVKFGVHSQKIHFIPYGTDVPTQLSDGPRSGILFYGGHHLMSGKGLDTLFQAAVILRERLADKAPMLKIHGHYGSFTPEPALKMAETYGIADKVIWLNQIDDATLGSHYRSASVCVLPYTGSFAGLAVGAAAANGVPVIATRRAGVPDHLGDSALWIEENNAEQLSQEIQRLLSSPQLCADLTGPAYERAKELLSWETVGNQTLDVYRQALEGRAARRIPAAVV